MSGETHVDHEVLARHAANKVNVPSDEARKRRTQVNHLREPARGAHRRPPRLRPRQAPRVGQHR